MTDVSKKGKAQREQEIKDGKAPSVALPDKKVTTAELAQHKSEGDVWVAIHGCVYDLSAWAAKHPGGAKVIRSQGGKDATKMFNMMHGAKEALFMITNNEAKGLAVLIGEYVPDAKM